MTRDGASHIPATPDLRAAERRVLNRIFQHPLSHNLTWREVIDLFSALGEVEHAHNGTLVLKLGGEHLTFATGHDTAVVTEDVVSLRRFLHRRGWTAEPAPQPGVAAPGRAVVIDHAGARVYDLSPGQASETHHLHHDFNRSDHDADRAETWPDDRQFFVAVALALAGEGPIVVLGHGKGQSNEADHLMAHLFKHHAAIHVRVVREIVADLPHLTVPRLLDLARHALQSVQVITPPAL